MIIRRGVADDAEAMASLEGGLFGTDAWSLPLVVSELSSPDRSTLVAVAEETLVGYAVTMRGVEVADLQRIAVRPDAQGDGVAGELLRRAVDEAAADGARRMLLEVSEVNRPAIALYTRAGFDEIDRRRGYYRDGTDALVLCLELQDPGLTTAPE